MQMDNGQKIVNLALQGGGSHGAFTWGVLDRLLEEERLSIEGITATSAGAINAVTMAYGLSIGGREGAKKALERLWKRLSSTATSSILQPSLFDKLYGKFGLDHSPGYVLFNTFCEFFSPYQFNPFNYDPLKSLLEGLVDFECLRQQPAVKLFLCATNVRTGKLKVFEVEEICVEHVLASCCRPLLTRAVEIKGEFYWDGGFIGNPPIFPVIYGCDALDVILVHLTPTVRQDIPTTPRAIFSRMQEISFNSSLMREMRAVAFVNKLIDDSKMSEGKKMRIHVIEDEDVISELSVSSKMNGDWDFLAHLHAIGRRRADDWLAPNFDRLGIESTIDIRARYL
jgi:NTE family protein